MPHLRGQLRNLALLYLAMAHGTDQYLGDNELHRLTERLQQRFPDRDPEEIREVVLEALSVYLEADDTLETATYAMMSLRSDLSPEQCESVLEDLMQVAEADGIILGNERGLLASLAECWGVLLTPEQQRRTVRPRDVEPWTMLHHLAFIYLMLAHGTDNELSEQEVQVMHKKLQEWEPGRSGEALHRVVAAAKERYAEGPDEGTWQASVQAVKAALPEDQRMAVLNDLVKIANADGYFLDDEEDMINTLMHAWELGAHSSYGSHGRKS